MYNPHINVKGYCVPKNRFKRWFYGFQNTIHTNITQIWYGKFYQYNNSQTKSEKILLPYYQLILSPNKSPLHPNIRNIIIPIRINILTSQKQTLVTRLYYSRRKYYCYNHFSNIAIAIIGLFSIAPCVIALPTIAIAIVVALSRS